MWFSKRPYFAHATKGGRIYLDYAGAPPLLKEASRAICEAEQLLGNPGAIHAEGVAAKKNLEESRARIARVLGCKAGQLIFTAGLTDSNNLAIVGYAKALERIRRGLSDTHWIVSSIEHDSVLASFAEVERMGGIVTHIDPNADGIVSPHAIAEAQRPETVFVSVGWANNEIGVVQPLRKIAESLRGTGRSIVFHSDAGQAPLYLPTLVNSLGVDLLSLGANKMYGPHGIGALYMSNATTLAPISYGGKQERGLHAGTESVALAAGLAEALEIVAGEREKESRRLEALRDELARELVARIPGVVVNGSTSLTAGGMKHVLPHMLNVSIPNIQSEYVTLALDAAGIAVSTKSACREGEESRSHVVYALGDVKNAESSEVLTKEERAANTLRFSLGRGTSMNDVRIVVKELVRILQSV